MVLVREEPPSPYHTTPDSYCLDYDTRTRHRMLMDTVFQKGVLKTADLAFYALPSLLSSLPISFLLTEAVTTSVGDMMTMIIGKLSMDREKCRYFQGKVRGDSPCRGRSSSIMREAHAMFHNTTVKFGRRTLIWGRI